MRPSGRSHCAHVALFVRRFGARAREGPRRWPRSSPPGGTARPLRMAGRVRCARFVSTTRVAIPRVDEPSGPSEWVSATLSRVSPVGSPSGEPRSGSGIPIGASGTARDAEPPAGSPAVDTAGAEQLLQLVDGLLCSVAFGRQSWNRGPFGGCPCRTGFPGTSRAPTAPSGVSGHRAGVVTTGRELGGVRARLGRCSRSALRSAALGSRGRGSGVAEDVRSRWLRSAGEAFEARRAPVTGVLPRSRPRCRRRSGFGRGSGEVGVGGSGAIGTSRFGGSPRVGAFGSRAAVQRTAVNDPELASCGSRGSGAGQGARTAGRYGHTL
jgi:hypothetical protein